jgi:hypothetical protein
MARNITNTPTKIYVNTVSAREPLELLTPSNTSSTMTLKGLNGFTANKFIKVNSTADGLEYGDDNDTQYTATTPLKLTGTAFSIDQNLFNITTTMNDNDEIILFDTSDNFDKILFSNFRTAITTTSNNFGTVSSGDISIGNNTHATTIYGVNTILNSESRNILTFTPAQNKFEIGNSTDKTRIFVPIFYGSSGTAKRLSILDTTLNNEIIFNTQSLSADITLTMPNSTGTLALFSQIPTNNNQLTNGAGYITSSSIPGATAPIVLTGGNYTLPPSSFTTITEVPNTNLILMVDSSNSYKKVTTQNLFDLYQDSINYNAELPLTKDTTNDKYTFTIRGLTAAVQAQVDDQMIMIMGNAGIDTFRKMTGLQLQQYITNEGVSFGTNIADLGDRTFGNGSRDSVYDGKEVFIKSLGIDRIRILDDLISIDRPAIDFRVGHNEDTNSFSNVSTTCRISSTNDLHLFTPSATFSNSINRFVCIAGSSQSQSETAMFGYAGGGITIANGGIPDGNTTTPIGSAFAMSTGSAGVFSIVNRLTTAFSSTTTQLQIKLNDTDFYTERVTINGNVGEAVLKLNSSGGALVGQSGRSYVGRDTSTGYIYLGNAVDSSELFSNLTYAKGIEFSRILKGTKTDTSFGSSVANMTAFPPIGQQLFETSTSVGQGYLVNTVYRVPSSTEKYFSCFQLQLNTGNFILGWGTHVASGSAGAFSQIFYIRSDGAYFGAGSLVTSDRRIKKDIINADGQECINILKSIKLKKYRYNDDWAKQRQIENNNYVYGFIAQDIGNSPELSYCCDNKTAPMTVDGEDIFDMNTIDKPKILSVLWGVCDAQQNKIEELETKVSAQQKEIDTLKSEIATIKAHLNL